MRSTKCHPTAEYIYDKLKPSFPNLSLATVYRNLNRFKEEGVIRSVGTVLGQERFDGDTSPHTHVVCTCCGRVSDWFDVPVGGETVEHIEKSTGFVITGSDLKFSGLCEDCSKR